MPNTLFGRLLLSSLLLLAILFGALSIVINQLYAENLADSTRQQLKLQNHLLLSAASFSEGIIELPEQLREARFGEEGSGLYGFVTNQRGNILWQSYSADRLDIAPALLKSQYSEAGAAEFVQQPLYSIYHYSVSWELIDDKPEILTFTVLESSQTNLQKISRFQERINLWLFFIATALIAVLLLVLRWGTAPLRQLESQIKQIEQGKSELLQGNYPQELQGLTRNLNELLTNEQRQRDRYQSTLSDLAHSLKTPLAVIQTELESTESQLPVIHSQAQRMDEIIKHQLQRAVISRPLLLTESVNIRETVFRLKAALLKVYAEKPIRFEIEVEEDVIFKGDQRDLMEVLGNILDNACKACKNNLKVAAKQDKTKLIISIHDDGPGVPPALRTKLFKRGQRADTLHSGQGIGLNVAVDIIESYQGRLSITDSPLGGALFTLEIPC